MLHDTREVPGRDQTEISSEASLLSVPPFQPARCFWESVGCLYNAETHRQLQKKDISSEENCGPLSVRNSSGMPWREKTDLKPVMTEEELVEVSLMTSG